MHLRKSKLYEQLVELLSVSWCKWSQTWVDILTMISMNCYCRQDSTHLCAFHKICHTCSVHISGLHCHLLGCMYMYLKTRMNKYQCSGPQAAHLCWCPVWWCVSWLQHPPCDTSPQCTAPHCFLWPWWGGPPPGGPAAGHPTGSLMGHQSPGNTQPPNMW